MADINGWEFILLIVIALVVLGPDRLPEYAAKLARLVRHVRGLAQSAQGQLREQMGPDFDDIDWRQYDPRQYDPRRIVREALLDPDPVDRGSPSGVTDTPAEGTEERDEDDAGAVRPTPWDVDAT